MLTNFSSPIINDMDISDMWFQQDDAKCYTTTETLNSLRTEFSDRIIKRDFEVNWLPRSCDLTPLDYFLWDYVKDQVYADNPQFIEALRTNI